MLRIGVDTGGTFTDFVVVDGDRVSVLKLPSTPNRPECAVLEGLTRILENRSDSGFLAQHGSTVATNALLERKGAKTVLVTTEGFEDILEIGRQNRPHLYRLSGSRSKPLVARTKRLGVKERTLSDGTIATPLEAGSLESLRARIRKLAPESIAVVLLHSYRNPSNEIRIQEALQASKLPISLSHQILPEFREYETHFRDGHQRLPYSYNVELSVGLECRSPGEEGASHHHAVQWRNHAGFFISTGTGPNASLGSGRRGAWSL